MSVSVVAGPRNQTSLLAPLLVGVLLIRAIFSEIGDRNGITEHSKRL